MASCISYERCVSRYGRQPGDSIAVPIALTAPRDSIRTIIQIDSIPYMVPGEVITVENPQSRAKIRYWKDQYENAINFQAECDTIVLRDTIFVRPPPVLDPPPPRRKWYNRIWDKYMKLLLTSIAIIFIIKLLK